jgi:hypothetical protein
MSQRGCGPDERVDIYDVAVVRLPTTLDGETFTMTSCYRQPLADARRYNRRAREPRHCPAQSYRVSSVSNHSMTSVMRDAISQRSPVSQLVCPVDSLLFPLDADRMISRCACGFTRRAARI